MNARASAYTRWTRYLRGSREAEWDREQSGLQIIVCIVRLFQYTVLHDVPYTEQVVRILAVERMNSIPQG